MTGVVGVVVFIFWLWVSRISIRLLCKAMDTATVTLVFAFESYIFVIFQRSQKVNIEKTVKGKLLPVEVEIYIGPFIL